MRDIVETGENNELERIHALEATGDDYGLTDNSAGHWLLP